MHVIEKTLLNPEEKKQISKLWNDEYPSSLRFADDNGFDQYLDSLSGVTHYLLKSEKDLIFGWACKFTREESVWFAIILSRDSQGKGYGSALLQALKKEEKLLNAWVIDNDASPKANGDFYKSPLEFYLKHKFKVHHEIRLETEKMSGVKINWER